MEKRNIAVAIILTIVTCGIYGIYWFIVMTNDANKTTEKPEEQTSGGVAFLLSFITCGIYGWYWAYKQGEKLDAAAEKNGMPRDSRSVLYLILSLIGFSIIAYALMQDTLNKIIDKTSAKQAKPEQPAKIAKQYA